MATISMFETKAEAEESDKAAASWVKDKFPELGTNSPQITAGEVRISKVA